MSIYNSTEYAVAFPPNLSKCLESEEIQRLEPISAKIQCHILVEWKKYSVGAVIPHKSDPKELLAKIKGEFEKIFSREDVPEKCLELHWDIFLQTPTNQFFWYRSDSKTYRSDQEEPYSAEQFTKHYYETARVLCALRQGYERIDVVNHDGIFVISCGMKIQDVQPPKILRVTAQEDNS